MPAPYRHPAHRRAVPAPTPFRLAVLERAGHRCELCGAPAIEAVDGARRPTGDGVAVCRACHLRLN